MMFDSNWFKLKWLKCRRRWWWSLFASVRALRMLARPIWRFCLLLMVDVRYGIHVWKIVYLHQETWKWNQCLAPVTQIVCCWSRTCTHIPSFGKSCVDYLQQSCINLEKCNDVLFSGYSGCSQPKTSIFWCFCTPSDYPFYMKWSDVRWFLPKPVPCGMVRVATAPAVSRRRCAWGRRLHCWDGTSWVFSHGSGRFDELWNVTKQANSM